MKKILLIENDHVFANVYRNKLILEGYEVDAAPDGDRGLDLIRSFQPDAVLLDLALPKTSGIEVIRQVRATPETEKLPLIVFTNTYLTSAIQEAWKAGATKCLAKANCTPNLVISVLRSISAPSATPDASSTSAAALSEPEVPDEPMSDSDVQEELKQSFAADFPALVTALRTQLQSIIKVENEAARIQQLKQMYSRIHGLTGNAGIVGMSQIARLSDALEALIKELYEKPSTINASTLRTVASALDCLAVLFENRDAKIKEVSAAKILVVDDEAISRRAVTHALDKAKLSSVAVEDPIRAMDLVALSRYDLVFLDVDMPNMNGYELCTKIRALPAYKKIPVVFVTSLNDFEARANSTMSGGNDFIAKPFLFIELAVKALVYVLRSQIPPKR